MPWKQDHAETRQFVKTAIGIRKKWIKPSDEWRVTAADAAENLLVFERVGKAGCGSRSIRGKIAWRRHLILRVGKFYFGREWRENALAGMDLRCV